MKQRREESYTQEMFRVVEMYCCDNCGTALDVVNNRRPDGWTTIYHQESERYGHSWDFCSYECFYGWVMAHEEGFPSKLEETMQRSIDQINQQRAEKEADKILSGVE